MRIVSKTQGPNNIESNVSEQTEVRKMWIKILPPHVARSATLGQCVSLSVKWGKPYLTSRIGGRISNK